ncbi:MAG TPA: proton-conducting transporter membrane subunit [Spirochaetota bacterium]|nr:proton-conducting transporter membrane subunit [Spirochaetota bacterium]
MIKHVPVLLVTIPLVVAFMLPIIGMVNRTIRTITAGVAIVIIMVLSYLLIQDVMICKKIFHYMVGSPDPTALFEHGLTFPIRIALKIDQFSLLFIIMATTLSFLFYLFSSQYIEENERKNYFTVLYVCMVAGMMGMLIANDLFTFFVFLEILSISSSALVSFRTERKHPPYAGYKYMFVSSIATSFFLLGIAFLYAQYGSFNIDYLKKVMDGTVLDKIAIVMLILPLAMKCGVVPMHMWIPDTYSEAPAPISSMVKLGSLICLYGLFRIAFTFGSHVYVSYELGIMFILFGVLSMFVGVTQALIQKDVKRLMAFHAVSQVGYMLLGVGVGLSVIKSGDASFAIYGKIAMIGGLFHVINNALYKGLLFLTSGIMVRHYKTRDLNVMHGLAHYDKFTALVFMIAALAISGIPPLNGFVSKLIIYESVFHYNPLLTLIAIFVSVLTLASFMKVFYSAFLGMPPERKPVEQPILVKFSMVILSIIIVAIGLFPQGIIKLLIEPAVNALATF